MASTRCKALILGCAGPTLTPDEEAFFSRVRPWGLILFKRNIVDAEQVSSLCVSFRSIVERLDAPVLIDQEGGRVLVFPISDFEIFSFALSGIGFPSLPRLILSLTPSEKM